MLILFWSSLFLIVYCYFGYPLLLWITAGLFARPVKKASLNTSISLIISLWNEEDVIEKKLQNLVSLHYPGPTEILIGSDGSSDQTNRIVNAFIAASSHENRSDKTVPQIRFFPFEHRKGKMAVLNELIRMAQNEILVFTDARQTFDIDAVRQLAANFNDRTVGCVSGELLFQAKDGATARGINLYWNYEKFMRRCESDIHSMLGATGAIYAIRKELFTPLPTNIILDDMMTPLKIVLKGYRAIFDGSAKAYDRIADNPREESKRKGRTLYGNYQIFFMLPQIFNLFKSPVALQMFSHKLLRVIAPLLLILTFLTNLSLSGDVFYGILFFLQVIFYVLAALGALTRYQSDGFGRKVSKVCYVPYVFCLLNFSALGGLIKFITARQSVLWEKARSQ